MSPAECPAGAAASNLHWPYPQGTLPALGFEVSGKEGSLSQLGLRRKGRRYKSSPGHKLERGWQLGSRDKGVIEAVSLLPRPGPKQPPTGNQPHLPPRAPCLLLVLQKLPVESKPCLFSPSLHSHFNNLEHIQSLGALLTNPEKSTKGTRSDACLNVVPQPTLETPVLTANVRVIKLWE